MNNKRLCTLLSITASFFGFGRSLPGQSVTAPAVVYDVTTDWQNNSNPNGVWQYDAGSNPLPWQGNFGTGSCAAGSLAGITGGYAGGINFNGNCIPAFIKATGDAANPKDYLKGDVIIASQDPANGAGEGQATLVWTAPAAGTVTITGAIWYAQSFVQRTNDFMLSLGSAVLASGTIAYNSAIGNNRSNPRSFSSSGALTVAAGDRVTLVLVRTAGESSSSIDGVQLTITETLTALAAPTIAAGGVVPNSSSATTIQPGSWISIYGSNLAAAPASWNADFPISLGGTGVTINGKPAYIWFVSPAQINAQAPDDTAVGPVSVVVTTAAGSASATVTLGPYGPSFNMLNGKYPAAIVPTSGPGNSGGGYDIIGPVGAFSFPTRPVKPGETLLLFGVGFGPTNPPVPAGHIFSGAANSPVLPVITIGGAPAQVTFAGIVEAGLFQFNVVVPNAGSGDRALQATIGGVSTPATVLLTIQ